MAIGTATFNGPIGEVKNVNVETHSTFSVSNAKVSTYSVDDRLPSPVLTAISYMNDVKQLANGNAVNSAAPVVDIKDKLSFTPDPTTPTVGGQPTAHR